MPVVLGDIVLPAEARLRITRISSHKVASKELLTIAQSDNASGALLRVNFDARGPNFGYLEACMRFIADDATEDSPLFLSSGAEDYFLGASYFDEVSTRGKRRDKIAGIEIS